MVLSEQKLNSVIGLDPECSVSMKIDESNNKKLMMILSQNLYQDPIGSIVREYVSNSLDAQREIGNNEPIIVKLIRENGNFVFKVIDNGIGLSPERVEKVFSKYLSSTKEKDENQLGYFGLGSKSGLAYVDSFVINSIYDNKVYTYLMLKSEEGTDLNLLDISDTNKHSGVTISINLKCEDDYEIFLEKIQSQLCYFEGVFIETEYADIDNNYKIIKNEDWKYSELNKDNNLHICLDNVYYPLDFKALGIQEVKLPIGLNFSLKQHIMPTPSREGFLYTSTTKQMILDRISKVGDYFIDQWNKVVPLVTTISEAGRLKDHFGQIILWKEETLGETREIKIKIPKSLEKVCTKTMDSVALSLFPNLNIDKLISSEAYLLEEYKVYGEHLYKGDNFKTKFGYRGTEEFTDLFPTHVENSDIYFLEKGESLTKEQIKYLKWNETPCRIVRKHSSVKLGFTWKKAMYYSKNCYMSLLDLQKKLRSEWRNLITEYQDYIKTYTDQFLTINDIVPTQEYYDWKESQKKERKVAKRNKKEEITIGYLREAVRGKQKYLSDNITCDIKELKKKNKIHIYCHEDERDNLEDLFELNCPQIKCIILTEQNYNKLNKYIKNNPLHNWIHLDNLWKNKIRPLSKLFTTYLLKELNIDYKALHKDAYIIDRSIENLQCSVDDRFKNNMYYSNRNIRFCNKGLKIYSNNKWLDYDLINDFKILVGTQHKFDFLSFLNFRTSDKRELKRLAIYLYLRQLKQEKISGVKNYEIISREEIEEKMNSLINPPIERIEEPIPICIIPANSLKESMVIHINTEDDREFSTEDYFADQIEVFEEELELV